MHKSIATIDSPEFLNLQPLDVNPLMSSCEIKVLYLGENRNNTFINKDVAKEMAKTLRGAPIVGYFKEEKNDFGDHGQQMILDDEGIKFNCLTKPYGFVAPNAEVWFQKFTDTDDFGNEIEREYMMTTGYLWTEQFEEVKSVIQEGRPQSMELVDSDGHWATNEKTGVDFFIINDAIFSKLCILGEDVEPCFEGASVTAPGESSTYSLMTDDFKSTLYDMMKELRFTLEGGKQKMEDEKVEVVNETITEEVKKVEENVNEEVTETKEEEVNNEEVVPAAEEEIETPVEEETEVEENNSEKMDNSEKEELSENNNSIDNESEIDSFAKKDKKEEEEKEPKEEEEEEEKKEEPKDEDEKEEDSEDDEDKKKKKYSLLESEYASLQEKYSKLEKEYSELLTFKKEVDNEKKDALIKKFYMLSEEDKKDVIENKENYSLDDIEAKLSVICVRKKVNFDLDNKEKNEEIVKDKDPITTFNVGNDEESGIPAWIEAVRKFNK